MSVHGYVTHAAENRRQTGWLIAAYIVAFQMVGGLAATVFIMFFDADRMLLSNPVGYFMRYGLPMTVIAGLLFLWLYNRHSEVVARVLDVKGVSRIDEPRFVGIAEEQCIALGIRAPRFGVIEVPQPNALAVGEGPARGLIAVTRGALNLLDDDELAAVIAHEAAHIRNGDTKVLAANHALMRTAVHLQVNNALRFEDWRQVIIPLLLPPFLIIMLASGFITMTSMKLAREARRGLKLTRDFIADGDAVRTTHFPEALASALRKMQGRGAFADSDAFEDLLFEGRGCAEGGSHPETAERVARIERLGAGLMDTARTRRDTRIGTIPARSGFGRKGLTSTQTPAPATMPARAPIRSEVAIPLPPPSAPRTKPPEISNEALLKLLFTDFAAYKAHVAHCTDYYEWRESDGRNFLGLKPELRLPLVAVTAFLLVLHWPSDGDYRKFTYKFSPTYFADIGKMTQNGPFCSGPSYPDGKCPEAK